MVLKKVKLSGEGFNFSLTSCAMPKANVPGISCSPFHSACDARTFFVILNPGLCSAIDSNRLLTIEGERKGVCDPEGLHCQGVVSPDAKAFHRRERQARGDGCYIRAPVCPEVLVSVTVKLFGTELR